MNGPARTSLAAACVALALALPACSQSLKGPAPTLEETSLTFCGGSAQAFVLRGSGLSPMIVDGATEQARVDLPDVCLVRVEDVDGNPVMGAPEVCVPEADVEWISQTELRFTTRASLGLAPGLYDVIVRNPDGKEVRGRVHLRVLTDGPLLFWADPSVVYNGISTQITVYGSNLGRVSTVAIRDSTTFVETVLTTTGPGMRMNRVQAIVPAGTPAGTYDVIVRDDVGCAAELIRGLRVTDMVTLTVSAIDPSFGWSMQPTAVTVTGMDFQNVPRAYLNPDMPAPGTVASALASVAFVSTDRLTGVVPQGLPVGLYDLIVVNPDGRVGLLQDAFRITDAQPPVVDNVSPNYLDNDGPKTVTIDGSHFASPTVSLTCRMPDGSMMTLAGTVSMGGTDTRFSASLPVGGLTQGTVCIVRVTNADGSYYDYSAVGVSNPASNLNAFAAGPAMATARRAPAAVSGRATRAARFLYAIGGDGGATSGALASVETTPVDIFGVPGAWFTQPVSLPTPRTLAGVVAIGRFLYLVGGDGGTGPTADVSRAEVLDPLAAPDIVDVAARRGMGAGIGPGVWYYRVSAVMAMDDPSNPGGETLASDPIAISLPTELEGTLVITLFWEPIPGAASYRVYRSPTPDMPVGAVQRLAEVAGGMTTSFEDSTGTPAAPGPLPLGATGVWMSMPSLGGPRAAAGVTAARDPMNPAQWHIYAIGGLSGAMPVASWERLSVTIDADDRHTVGTWTAGTTSISAGRSELTAYAVSHENAVQVAAGTTYIYAAGGAGMARSVTDVDVAVVAAGGDLVQPGGTTPGWTPADAMSPGRAGYAGLAGAGFLFAFGGQNGAPSDGNGSAEVDPGAPPALVNWNNEGVRLLMPRYLAGSAVESAFIYVVGGQSGGGATASMERTVL